MNLQTLDKEAEAYSHIHHGEKLVVVGDEEQLDTSAFLLNTLRAEWNMQFDTLQVGGKSSNLMDATREVRKLLEDDDQKRLLVLSQSGGIADPNLKTIPLLTQEKIRAILEGGQCVAPLTARTRAELALVLKALDITPKATITNAQQLAKELISWFGAGTLAINRENLTLGQISPHEKPIFDAMYKYQVEQGKFRGRSEAEVNRMRDSHHVLRIDRSPIGGASFTDKEGLWTELCAFWAGTEGHGIGRMLLDQVPELARRRNVYALSTDPGAIGLFRKHNAFQNMGRLSGSYSQLPATLQPILEDYNTSKRDPEVFIAMREVA